MAIGAIGGFSVPVVPGYSHRGRISICIVLFVLALVPRLVPLLRPGVDWAKNNHWDSNGYIQLADGLRQGCGFARKVDSLCSAPEIVRTPGFPVFLALFRDARSSLAVQAFLGAVVCLLIGYAMYVYWGPVVGILSAALIALDLTSIVWATQIMSEILFQFLVAIAVVLEFYLLSQMSQSFNYKWAICLSLSSAVFLALAILVRPIGIVLIPVMALFLLFKSGASWSSRTAITIVMVLVPALTIATWTQRNASVAGVSTFSAIGAKNLYFYRAASVVKFTLKLSDKETAEFLRKQLNWPEGFSLKATGPIARQSADTIQAMNRLGKEILAEHFLTFAALTLRDFVYLLLTPGLADVQLLFGYGEGYEAAPPDLKGKFQSLRNSPLGLIATVLFHWCLLLLTYVGVTRALVLCLRCLRDKSGPLIFLLVVGTMLLLAAAGPEGEARFRVPAMPFLAMVAAVGLSWRRRSQAGEVSSDY